MISTLLLLVSVGYLGFLTLVELWVAFSHEPTISERVQGWVKANYQLAIAFAAVAGWLICHFSSPPVGLASSVIERIR
jgi:hypothetical protein